MRRCPARGRSNWWRDGLWRGSCVQNRSGCTLACGRFLSKVKLMWTRLVMWEVHVVHWIGKTTIITTATETWTDRRIDFDSEESTHYWFCFWRISWFFFFYRSKRSSPVFVFILKIQVIVDVDREESTHYWCWAWRINSLLILTLKNQFVIDFDSEESSHYGCWSYRINSLRIFIGTINSLSNDWVAAALLRIYF